MLVKPTIAQQSVYDLCAYILTFIGLLVCGFILQKIVPVESLVTENVKAIFIPSSRFYLVPETKERILFVALIGLLLPVNFIALRIVSLKTAQDKFFNNALLHKKIALLMSFMLLLPVCSAGFLPLIIGLPVIISKLQTLGLQICATVMLAAAVFLSASTLRPLILQPRKAISIRWLQLSLAVILSLVILISVLSFRVLSIFEVNEEQLWITHFEAVFYTVSQVVAGKTLLVDLPAQYGMYSEILKPIFSVIGLSVLNFTAVMAFLQIIGMLALLWLCLRLIKNNILKFFCVASLCLLMGETWRLRLSMVTGYYFDEVYQVWPLRFVFPALSLCVFYALQKHSKSYSAIILMAGFSGLAIVWNLDSGIPVFGAFLAYLFLRFVFPIDESREQVIKKTLLAIMVVLIGVISFGMYLQLKAGQAIQWQDWMKYQRIFYQTGFGMLPIPINTLHPWMAIIGVYVFAITGALSRRMQRKPALIWDLLFFMAIMGLGLFSYYQGRSHIINCIQVAWPAIIIAFILTDRTLRAIRGKLLPLVFLDALLPILLLGSLWTAIFINSVPMLLSVAQQHVQLMSQAPKTRVTENIAFIRHWTQGTKQAVIISPFQAVYFAETGLASAINGPGIVETMLVADFERFYYILRTEQTIRHLFVEEDQLPQVLAKIDRHYKIKARSGYGLVYLSAF